MKNVYLKNMHKLASLVIYLIRARLFIPLLRSIIYRILYNKNSSYRAYIYRPLIFSANSIIWRDGVYIRKNCRIEAIKKYGEMSYHPSILLEEGVTIQQNCHITCAQSIIIGQNTALASNVSITDIDHSYQDIFTPIERQNITVNPVKIGSDCKIYNNAVILKGTVIGHHCVVGANSVVNGIFPDYSIIVGVPAKIVKRFDFAVMKWRKTDKVGNFID